MPATRRKPTPVECSICSKVISRKGDLPRHMQTHASNKEELKLPCPIPGCKVRTLQKSNLQTHIATHTGKGLRYCPDCAFATTSASTLTRHRKKHHGHRPYGREASPPSAAAPYPSVRYVTPEVSSPAVSARRSPRSATPDSRASSRNSPLAGSSNSLRRSSPPTTINQPSPPVSPLLTSTRTRNYYLPLALLPKPLTQEDYPTFNFSSLS
ncbi:hypothetical protein P692DRAFT_20827410 [Suillus brevipes Sb2]|nr:hypothetical protein P692DRAFT_20827410 [Suillus brevipes Sb2]